MPRVSKIAKLPPHVRDWLHKAYVEHAFGDTEGVTRQLNELLKNEGIPETVGETAVYKEGQRVKRAQEAVAASTRAMQLIADTARDDADKRGEALNAMLSGDMFEALLAAREAEAEPDMGKRIGLLNKAALAAARLTTSSVRQRQWRAEVDAKAKAAAESVAKIARAGGMTREQTAEIRRQILGIAKRTPEPQAAAPP